MALAPSFSATPRSSSATISTANTGRDGTGTIGTVFTSPATRSVSDAVFNSTILVTSATAAFTEADRGKVITGDGIPAGTTIAAVLSATNVHLSAATTTTGSSKTVAVVGAGSRVDEIKVKGVGTTAAGVVVLYVYDGTTARIYDEVTIGAVTASTTAAAVGYTLLPNNLILPPGYSLRASTTIAQSIAVTATGGDF